MPLLSASELKNLADLVESGMSVTVKILRRTVSDDAYSDDDTVTYPVVGTVTGWLRHVPAGVQEVVGGVVGNVSQIRLLVPIGTDIRNADRIVFTDPATGVSETMVVQDTNFESYYKTSLRVILRHLD